MSNKSKAIVYAMLIGWWFGSVYPTVGIVGICLLAAALEIFGARRSAGHTTTKEG